MRTEYLNKGVCSSKTIVDINDDHVIEDIQVIGGCNGNLKGIMSLLRGMKAEEAIEKLSGIRCGLRATSCPDQISKALKEAIGK